MTTSKIPVVSIVATLLPDMGIGCKGTLPWKLSKEMKYFRQVTTNTVDKNRQNVVLMGRKTWESIPVRFRPLPNRLNVVISRSSSNQLIKNNTLGDDKVYYEINSIKEAVVQLRERNDIERIYIIGGGEIYNASFDVVDYWLITQLSILTDNENKTQNPSMDTFLDKKRLLTDFEKDTIDGFQRFLSLNVDLPKETHKSFIDSEKGYQFEYTLYRKKD